MSKRIYCIEGDDGEITLVRASAPSQAIARVARVRYTVRVATQEDIVRAMQLGEPIHNHDDDVSDNGD